MEKVINDCWNNIGVWGKQQPRCEKLNELVHCHNCEIYSQSGQLLLSRAIDEDYLEEWRHNLSLPKSDKGQQLISALAFRMGDEWFAMTSRFICEITHCDKYHSLPHRKNNVLRGLVNVRGELLLNVSLGYLFKINKSEASKKHGHERFIVIDDGNEKFAFPATEVREIIRYNIEDMQNPPATTSQSMTSFVKGIIRHKETEVAILDDELVFTALHKNI